MKSPWICATCGSAVEIEASNCPACGSPNSTPQQTTELQQENLIRGEGEHSETGVELDAEMLRQTVIDFGRRLEKIEQHLGIAEKWGVSMRTIRPVDVVEQKSVRIEPFLSAATSIVPGASDTQRNPEPWERFPASSITKSGSGGGAPLFDSGKQTPPGERTKRRISFDELEAFVSGKGLAWIGGLAVLTGAVFFMSLAFNKGWIGPAPRVLIGVVVAFVMMAVGALFFERREATLGHVLVAVGLGMFSLSMVAATRLYDLIPIELGLLLSLASALIAAAIAIRANLQVVAGYGIVAALAAPFLLDAEPSGSTIAFLAVSLVGTTAIALYRTWVWLPILSFVLTVGQFVEWAANSDDQVAPTSRAVALAALAAFWLLYAIAAGGVEFRINRNRLTVASACLLVANATFALITGLVILEDDGPIWLGSFIAALGCAHILLGTYFFITRGKNHPFGLLATGLGLTGLTLSVPVIADGAIVPVIWSAGALALVWLSTRLSMSLLLPAAAAIGSLSVAHILLIEYGEHGFSDGPQSSFLSSEAGAIFAVLLAGFVATRLVGRPLVGRIVAATCGLLLCFAIPFELNGWQMAAAWCAVAIALVAMRNSQTLAIQNDSSMFARSSGMRFVVPRAILEASAAVAWLLALCHLIFSEYPHSEIASKIAPVHPFLHEAGGTLLIVSSALCAIATLVRSHSFSRGSISVVFLLIAYVLPFELSGVGLVAAWTCVMMLTVLAATSMPTSEAVAESDFSRWRRIEHLPEITAGIAFMLAACHVITHELDPQRLRSVNRPGMPFFDEPALATLFLVTTSLIAARLTSQARLRQLLSVGSYVMLFCLVPFETGHAATVVFWSALGTIALMVSARPGANAQLWIGIAGMTVASALALTFLRVAPLERLFVDARSTVDHTFLFSAATAAVLALAGFSIAVPHFVKGRQLRDICAPVAGVLVVYALSVAIVDHFQRQVGGSIELDVLSKRAQVALSILWAVLGGVIFIWGVARTSMKLRGFGLGLLGIATAKVFVWDLSTLNTSYRVLSFVGLGVLLLASSYFYQRITNTTERPSSEPLNSNGLVV